ncbi:MAG: substrate-binding domain-containing protein [Actinomycetota bacterium]
MAQPLADMGRTAADLLMERIADPSRSAVHRRMETRIVVRGSSA